VQTTKIVKGLGVTSAPMQRQCSFFGAPLAGEALSP